MAELNTNLNVNTNVGKTINEFKILKQELKDNIGALAGLQEGTAAFNEQALKVGQLKDRIADLNQTVASVSGSPIENLTGSFGLLSGQVKNLDFDGATTSLSSFAGQIKSFSFKDLISGAKSFGSTLGQLGKAILTNPIFLLIGVVTAIGAAVFALKDKIKFLGDAFDAVGDIIDGVVQAGKDFLDFLGLTSFAVEDKAAKTIEAAKAEEAAVTDRYDREIKIAQAAGKDTAKLEEAKRQAVLKTLKAQLDALKTLREAQGEYTEEQFKQIQDIGKQFKDIQTEAAVNENKRIEESKKTNKAAYDAQTAANKQLNKQIEDENIAAIKDDEQRAFAKVAKDRERRDQDINASKASAEVKRQALVASEIQLATDLAAVNKTFDDKRTADAKKKEDEEKEAAAKKKDELQRDLIAGAELKVEQDKLDLEAQVGLLTAKRDVELANDNLTANEKLLIQQKYFNDVAALRETDAEKARQLRLKEKGEALDIASSLTSSLSTLSDVYFSVKNKNLKKGSKEEEEAAKKQFKVQKALALTGAIIDGAKAVVTTLASAPLAIGPAPNPVGIASLAAVILSSVASIAKIASTQYNSSGSGGGGAAASVGSGVTAAAGEVSAGNGPISSQFSAETVGQAGTADGSGGANKRTSNGGDAQRVYVLESDITNTQKKVKTIESQATIG